MHEMKSRDRRAWSHIPDDSPAFVIMPFMGFIILERCFERRKRADQLVGFVALVSSFWGGSRAGLSHRSELSFLSFLLYYIC